MAQFNENITLAAPNPLDKRYLSSRTLFGSQLPYSSCTEVTTTISTAVRYSGLTVLISTGGTNLEFWFRQGVADGNLILKTLDVDIPEGDFITGATNLGYFSGTTGIQSLCISPYSTFNPVNYTCYVGDYQSLYNYYYRDCNGIIRIGEPPSDYIPKRGYVHNPTILNPNYKSWIWNERVCGSELTGWILIDGNISNQLGTFQYGCIYYTGSSQVFTNTTWSVPGSKGTLAIIAVEGSLSTGSTLIIGARSFACAEHNNLHFRTIISETPNLIRVWDDDDTLIHLSGRTAVLQAANEGTGEDIFLGQTGTTLYFKRIRGSGATTVSTVGGTLIVSSTLTGGTGGGTYNLSSPSAIPLGGICAGTVLTGKTSFQLFEELLVPELCGTITAPSLSIGLTCTGIKEIGCVLSQTITGTFSRGSISPQYCSVSPFRSGCVNAYCLCGCGMSAGFQACTVSPASQTNASYTVIGGAQSWGGCARYDAGSPALGSKGTLFCAALTSGCTLGTPLSITGILPWYYGVSASGTITGSDIANACMAKTVAVVGASTPITYNAVTQFLWFAAPTGSYTTKTKWWVCAANAGNIGGTGELWKQQGTVSVTSAESCWSGCSYDVYVTCGITTTAVGIPMCLYY